ncbi:uncharacterized protein KY384_006252 [Bacidia gigantensis]|uniref:uncharacterized protein n=1 Tax=Bacidia gigantensis TaxID=2732470 RepID=UPI001D049FF5|nr:uncharacterized protein KY384_006252 [Bacidia gigantensis]KAG8529615.1 hypothetical protein KY384_006252 [Bacidia gigantensis]
MKSEMISSTGPAANVALPQITLDTTLSELYRKFSPLDGGQSVAYLFYVPISSMDITTDFPRNRKYIYQETTFNNLSQEAPSRETDKALHIDILKYLHGLSQRETFLAGDAPVISFYSSSSKARAEHDRHQLARTLDTLDPHQRPNIIFCSGPKAIPLKENGIDILSYKFVLDGIADYPLRFDLDKHWYLNSKEALATSGLPTPKCEVIHLDGCMPHAKTCCNICKDIYDGFVPSTCTGIRGEWLHKSVQNVVSRMAQRPLPFVVKNTQAYAGAGTYVTKSEEERTQLIENFSTRLLPILFSHVTPENQHLKPGTILLTDCVEDYIGNFSISFFVALDGSATFLSVTDQVQDSQAWMANIITYSQQPALEQKTTPLMREIAKWLHGQGYSGPAGADVMETAATQPQPQHINVNGNLANGNLLNGTLTNGHHPNTNLSNGTLPPNGHTNPQPQPTPSAQPTSYIIDLNIRSTASFSLALLRTHFTSRGLDCASSFAITTGATRDEFLMTWKEDFEAGRIVVLNWYEEFGGFEGEGRERGWRGRRRRRGGEEG